MKSTKADWFQYARGSIILGRQNRLVEPTEQEISKKEEELIEDPGCDLEIAEIRGAFDSGKEVSL